MASSNTGRMIVEVLTGRWLSGGILAVMAVLLAIEGTWKVNIHLSWPFLTLVVVMMLALAATVVSAIWRGADRGDRKGTGRGDWRGADRGDRKGADRGDRRGADRGDRKGAGNYGNAGNGKKSGAFVLSHLGFLVIVFGWFCGAPSYSQGQMIVGKTDGFHIACTVDGMAMPVPFDVKLKDFSIDYYGDGVSPKQYTSTLEIDGKTLSTSVNHPCRYKGYLIYQSDYDRVNGEYSVLKLVRDPWLPIVYLGMILLALAAVMEMRKTWHSKAVLPVVILLAAAFAAISLARINFGTLMPALRSLWFIPHLIIYMLAYSVMAISLISGIISLFSKKVSPELAKKLLATSSSLLIIGMLCGAAWAKAAWGDYWTWDAKENWAAVTWLLTLIGTHIPSGKKNIRLVIMVALSFLAMQVTWYGVNYLPAAKYSMHTYNK